MYLYYKMVAAVFNLRVRENVYFSKLTRESIRFF